MLVITPFPDAAYPSDPPPTGPPSSRSGNAPEDAPAKFPHRILVVEDEIFVRLDIERTLTAAGYDVVGGVDNAAAAIALARQERPDLVLMDIRLAGARDGIDAAFQLWRDLQIPCLFVSANLDDATKQRAAPAQPWGFVSKPFSEAELLAAIQRHN